MMAYSYMPPTNFKADHPFVILLKTRKEILFMGRKASP
jgi:serine protease inhibitor